MNTKVDNQITLAIEEQIGGNAKNVRLFTSLKEMKLHKVEYHSY